MSVRTTLALCGKASPRVHLKLRPSRPMLETSI